MTQDLSKHDLAVTLGALKRSMVITNGSPRLNKDMAEYLDNLYKREEQVYDKVKILMEKS